MVTTTQWRRLALSMPEAEENSHFGQPDFRVRGKIFAGLYENDTQGVLKLPPELQSMLLDSKPNVFVAAAGAWGRSGWTRVILAEAELAVVRELVVEAWRLIAPKRLVAAHSGPIEPAAAIRKRQKRRRPSTARSPR